MIYFTEHGTDGFLTTLINMHKCNTNTYDGKYRSKHDWK